MEQQQGSTALGAAPRGVRSHIDWFVVFLCVVLAVLLLSIPVVGLVHTQRANTALAHAKTARLAARTVAMQYYAGGKPFADQTSESGFVPEAYDEIVFLAKSPGEVHLRRVGSNGYDILQMEYTEGAYTVLYDAQQDLWTVSYFQAILTPSSAT